ncbi:MAG: hypothetical protein WBO36_01530, partial [Saprospiraceae bacterium]
MKYTQSLVFVYLIFLLASPDSVFCQSTVESAATPTKEERYAKMQNKLVYPLIKGSYMTGVMPILFANDHPSSKK